MARRGSLSDDWELLQTNHDVLSCSDTETSEGENDSLEASAIIEALEETPATNLQGLTLGSLPQFLGGWYGSSPPAAGRTFTVDLSSSPPTSNTVAVDEPQAANDDAKETPVSESFEDAEDELSAGVTSTVSGATSSGVAAAPIKEPTPCTKTTSSSTAATTEPTAAEATAAADSAPFLLHTVLLVLLSAAALAIMLLLLGAAAGTRANSSTPYSINSSPYITHTSHTTSTEAFKPFSRKINRASFVGGKFPGANRKLYNRVAAPTAATAAASTGTSTTVASGSTTTASGRRELPWWLQYNASSAMRRATAGVPAKLPGLPPALQSVVDGSIRANMSASQRFRLHLWLMHCAARNNTATQHKGRDQVGIPRKGDVSLATPFPFFTTPAHTRLARPVAYVHQCSLPGTARGWRTVLNPSAPPTGTFQCKGIRTGNIGASKGCVAALCFAFQCRTDAANTTHAPAATVQAATTAPARPVAPPPVPAPVASAPIALWAVAAAPAAPARAAPAAAAATVAAAAAAGRQRVIVPPTEPVPPLYRPPLPCLLLGGPRPNTAQHRSARHSTAQHSAASAPVGRTHTWPNMTLGHQQGSGSRAWAARSSSQPSGRTLSIGMANWKWYQQSTANRRDGRSGSRLTLPMLPRVCWPAAASKQQQQQQQAGQQAVGLTLPMLPPVSDSEVFSTSASTADALSTSAQHQVSHTCVTECAQLCHEPYSCGAVCVERCPGLPHMYTSIPASGVRSFAGEHPGAIPMPPAEDAVSAQLAAATVADSAGKYSGGAIPLPPVALFPAPSCMPKTFGDLAAVDVLAVPDCAPATLANLTQCKRNAAANAAAKCGAASLAALAQCKRTIARGGDGCAPALLAGLAMCKRAAIGAGAGCPPATIAALTQCRRAIAKAAAADCAPASIPALAQCKQPVSGTAAESAPVTIPLLVQCKTEPAGSATSGCALASLARLAQSSRDVIRAAANCSPASLAALAQCNNVATGATVKCAPASLAALTQCKRVVLGSAFGCAAASLPALAHCRRAEAATEGASTSTVLRVRTPLPVLAPTAGTAPRMATAMCAPTQLAALAPAATAGSTVRTCHNNSTAVNALSASVKLAAAAGNLAAAAADLASAAAKLATAAGTLRNLPPRSITNSPAGRMSAQLHAAPENVSTPALTLPQLMPIVEQGEPSVDAAAGAASSVSTRCAGQDVTTGWVASLITLPMLPPTQDERDHDTCVDSDLAGSVADASSAADGGDRMYLAPLQPGVSLNATSKPVDASNGKPGQPFWRNPVM